MWTDSASGREATLSGTTARLTARRAARHALAWLAVLAAAGCEVGDLAGSGDGDDGKADGWGTSGSAWVAERQWSDHEEATFQGWIAQLGQARAAGSCSTLAGCLASPEANSLYGAEDAQMSVYADCADTPYVLRAYFAYKRRLPFSFVSSISGGHYTSGNRVTGHSDFTDYGSLRSLLRAISEQVHSGFYRLAPDVEDGDHYPISISRETVRPGTIYYDPNGHVLLVYAIEENGTVRLMDGHPDNSLTVTRFGEALARGSAAQGGGFRAWRPIAIDNSGTLRRTPNSGCAGFSATEQYQSGYSVDGRSVGYHEWVRYQLAEGGGVRRPVEEFDEMLQGVCNDILARVDAVDRALAAGIHQRPHPDSLPDNIYGTTGDWELYSSPSRDARLKAAFREMHRFITETVAAVESGDAAWLEYDGTAAELVDAYRQAWNRAASGECTLAYSNSRGTAVELDLNDVMDRLFDISFDPYHCPELRWGARPDVAERAGELASCPDNATKLEWYRDEQRLRNAIDRDYDARTTIDFGPVETPDIHIPRLLERLGG